MTIHYTNTRSSTIRFTELYRHVGLSGENPGKMFAWVSVARLKKHWYLLTNGRILQLSLYTSLTGSGRQCFQLQVYKTDWTKPCSIAVCLRKVFPFTNKLPVLKIVLVYQSRRIRSETLLHFGLKDSRNLTLFHSSVFEKEAFLYIV